MHITWEHLKGKGRPSGEHRADTGGHRLRVWKEANTFSWCVERSYSKGSIHWCAGGYEKRMWQAKRVAETVATVRENLEF